MERNLMEPGMMFGGTLMLVLSLLAIAVAVLWILVPFAIFGTKPLLQQVIDQQRRTNELLTQLQASRDRAR
jgi:heme exporter protein D